VVERRDGLSFVGDLSVREYLGESPDEENKDEEEELEGETVETET
jgi:hypothetical protein